MFCTDALLGYWCLDLGTLPAPCLHLVSTMRNARAVSKQNLSTLMPALSCLSSCQHRPRATIEISVGGRAPLHTWPALQIDPPGMQAKEHTPWGNLALDCQPHVQPLGWQATQIKQCPLFQGCCCKTGKALIDVQRQLQLLPASQGA